MRIQVSRTGGFAGIALHADVETAHLEAAERDRLNQLVADAAFFSLPAKIEAQEAGYDRFQYEITVEQAARVHTVACGDAMMSETLNELVRLVLVLGRRAV